MAIRCDQTKPWEFQFSCVQSVVVDHLADADATAKWHEETGARNWHTDEMQEQVIKRPASVQYPHPKKALVPFAIAMTGAHLARQSSVCKFACLSLWVEKWMTISLGGKVDDKTLQWALAMLWSVLSCGNRDLHGSSDSENRRLGHGSTSSTPTHPSKEPSNGSAEKCEGQQWQG